MGVIIEPNLIVEDIKLEVDDNNEYGANQIIDAWGPTMPVIKINDYVLGAGEIKDFNLKIKYNSIPKFSLTLEDSSYKIRKTLKKEIIDKIIIFIGYKDWYIKFNGIILNIPSDIGDDEIYIIGEFFNDKLYESIQKPYNNKNVSDIFKDICTLTNMGLFTYSNNSLTNTLENCLNTNKKHLDFFIETIEKFTNNIWCLDTFGYFHISDIETLRKQPVDKFKIFEGKVNDEEKDIIITTNIYDNTGYNETDGSDSSERNTKFLASSYTITTNIGKTHINNNNKYDVKTDNGNKILKSNETIGISNNTENTFSRFLNSYFPYYNDIINKDIGGKTISVTLKNLIYEITPFSIVNLEVYLPKDTNEVDNKLDEENSGNKIVIGYEYEFSSKSKNNLNPTIRQTLDLI